MKKTVQFVLFVVLMKMTTVLSALLPTERYLEKFDETKVAQIVQEDALKFGKAFDFSKHRDFFRKIIASEDENFIGYHATTVHHWIFQEFVRATLEEKHGWTIPEDFYFLRTPMNPKYDTNGREDCIKKFGRPEYTAEELKNVVYELIDAPIYKKTTQHLDWKLVKEEKISRLYYLLLHFAVHMPNTNLTKQEASKELKALLNEMLPAPISDAKKIKLQKTIQAFALDPFNSKKSLVPDASLYPAWLPIQRIVMPFDDTDEDFQQLIVSLNIPLYGNVQISTESTIHIFANNASVELDPEEAIEIFFESNMEFFKDLDMKAIKKLYQWAIPQVKANGGIILQFLSDPQMTPRDIDSIFYVSNYYGNPLFNISVKEEIDHGLGDLIYSPIFNQQILLHKQIRLILTNEWALNPFSGLKIKAYDKMEPAFKVELKRKIREIVGSKN